jgi:hypothetical protein
MDVPVDQVVDVVIPFANGTHANGMTMAPLVLNHREGEDEMGWDNPVITKMLPDEIITQA